MWPFKKKPKPSLAFAPPQQISFSQVDITERFSDNLSLGPGDWIETAPLNASIPNPESQGLPAIGATEEEVYRGSAFAVARVHRDSYRWSLLPRLPHSECVTCSPAHSVPKVRPPTAEVWMGLIRNEGHQACRYNAV